jgi:hypothetical protein
LLNACSQPPNLDSIKWKSSFSASRADRSRARSLRSLPRCRRVGPAQSSARYGHAPGAVVRIDPPNTDHSELRILHDFDVFPLAAKNLKLSPFDETRIGADTLSRACGALRLLVRPLIRRGPPNQVRPTRTC